MGGQERPTTSSKRAGKDRETEDEDIGGKKKEGDGMDVEKIVVKGYERGGGLGL